MKFLKKCTSFAFIFGVVVFLLFLPPVLYYVNRSYFFSKNMLKTAIVNRENVISILRQVKDPETFKNIYDMGLVKDVRVENGNIRVVVRVYKNCPYKMELYLDLKMRLKKLKNAGIVDIRFDNLTYDEYWEILKGKRFYDN